MLEDERKIAELHEAARHNRASEEEQKRATKGKFFGDALKTIGGIVSKGVESGNHFFWYTTEGLDIESLANIDWDYALSDVDEYDGVNFKSSGIMRILFTPTIGAVGTKERSAVEEATTVLWQKMRGTNTGSIPYTESDIPKLVMDVDGKLIFLARCIRAYGLSKWYSLKNENETGRKALAALGFNYDSLLADQEDYRAVLNSMINEIKSYPLPKDLDLITRHVWLQFNIWADTDVGKCRLYAYDARQIPVFRNEYAAVQYFSDYLPVSLAPVVQTATLFPSTSADLSTTWTKLMYSLTGSQGLKTMISDMRKAIGNMEVPFNAISDEFVIPVGYDDRVLWQIYHTTLIGTLPNSIVAYEGTVGTDLYLGYRISDDGRLHFGYHMGLVSASGNWETKAARDILDRLIPYPIGVVQNQAGINVPTSSSSDLEGIYVIPSASALPNIRREVFNSLNLNLLRLSTPHEYATPEEVVVFTRNLILFDKLGLTILAPSAGSNITRSIPSGGSYGDTYACVEHEHGYGSEIYEYAVINKFDGGGVFQQTAYGITAFDMFSAVRTYPGASKLQMLATIEQFDWHMKLFIFGFKYVYDVGVSKPDTHIFWESDNVAFISRNYMQRMHNYAVKGEWDVTAISTSNSGFRKFYEPKVPGKPAPGTPENK